MQFFHTLVPAFFLLVLAGIAGTRNPEFGVVRACILFVASLMIFGGITLLNFGGPTLPLILFGVLMLILLVAWFKFSIVSAVLIMALWAVLMHYAAPPVDKVLADALHYYHHWSD